MLASIFISLNIVIIESCIKNVNTDMAILVKILKLPDHLGNLYADT